VLTDVDGRDLEDEAVAVARLGDGEVREWDGRRDRSRSCCSWCLESASFRSPSLVETTRSSYGCKSSVSVVPEAVETMT
jgi:hypothetical protein